MHPVHIAVSILNLVCGAAAVLLFVLPKETTLHTLAAFAVVGGYFANILAVAITLALVIVLAVRTARGQGRAYLSKQWLGLFNGSFVVIFWGSLLLYWKLVAS